MPLEGFENDLRNARHRDGNVIAAIAGNGVEISGCLIAEQERGR
jgi:hypothetical protein